MFASNRNRKQQKVVFPLPTGLRVVTSASRICPLDIPRMDQRCFTIYLSMSSLENVSALVGQNPLIFGYLLTREMLKLEELALERWEYNDVLPIFFSWPSLQSSLTLSLLRCILTDGNVFYDGLNTNNINLDALRSNITIIPQIVSQSLSILILLISWHTHIAWTAQWYSEAKLRSFRSIWRCCIEWCSTRCGAILPAKRNGWRKDNIGKYDLQWRW